jgi:hypothetical protein
MSKPIFSLKKFHRQIKISINRFGKKCKKTLIKAVKKSKKDKIHYKTTIVTEVLLIILLGMVLVVKDYTSVAAILTDNYLRPIFGNKPVILLEKIFYNTSDKLTQLFGTKDSPPVFTANDPFAPPTERDLKLEPIPVNPKFTSLKNEGVWFEKNLNIFSDKMVLAYTFVRPDLERAYANVTLIQADMGPLVLGVTAGQKQPGTPIGNPGPGIIPNDIVQSGRLVAAFNGGFQYRDGMYGMIVDGKTYLPLKPDLGTLVGYKNGSIKIVNYHGQDLGNDISFIRQNCPILIENGDLSVINPVNRSLWGRTLTSDIYTWRSGIGTTSEGNLIYAVGNNLNPTTLAEALKMGGATNAIQLDINPFWVRFSIFNYLGDGKYDSVVPMKGIYNGAKEFLGGYEKDFFFLYKR